MIESNKVVIMFHQSGLLYGSDRIFFHAVIALRNMGLKPVVVLAEGGVLVERFRDESIVVHIAEIAKIQRRDFSVKGIVNLLRKIVIAKKEIGLICKEYENQIELFYINTAVIFYPLIYAKLNKIPTVWHIHELVYKPYVINCFYRLLVKFFANKRIYVSRSAQLCYEDDRGDKKRRAVVVDNFCVLEEKGNKEYGQLLFRSDGKIKVAIVGRVYWLKGHACFLNALELLSEDVAKRIAVYIIGDPLSAEDPYWLELKCKIEGLHNISIDHIPFVENLVQVYKDVDILVVPSLEPESFGLVALEGMLNQCAVLASGIGALKDLIQDGVTGFLFAPGSTLEMASKLEMLVLNAALRKRVAETAVGVVSRRYNRKKFYQEIQMVVRGVINEAG